MCPFLVCLVLSAEASIFWPLTSFAAQNESGYFHLVVSSHCCIIYKNNVCGPVKAYRNFYKAPF